MGRVKNLAAYARVVLGAAGLLFASDSRASGAEALIATNAPRIGLVEAMRATLQRDPNIQIQEEQVKFSKGSVLREAGVFDFTFDSELSQGTLRTPRTLVERLINQTNRTEVVADITSQRASVGKLFRAGPSASAGVELNRIGNNIDPDVANRANVNFVLNVPLLKGFGSASTAANELAAKVVQEGAVLELGFVTSQRLLNTAATYWELLGAEVNLETLTASATRASNLLQRVRQLVSGGEIPAAELRQTEADLARKSAEVKAGEQRFVQARQNFGLALGYSSAELHLVPLPQPDWPALDTNSVPPMFTGQSIIDRSLLRRGDYQAAIKSESAAAVLEKAARKDLKPQLDLTMELSYAGLSEGSEFRRFYTSLDPRPVDGPSAVGTLRFVYPFGNRSARGLLVQREALRSQAKLREQNLARGIGSAILVAFSDLEQSSQEALRAREAVALYRQTVDNEREKLRIGASTIVDIITIADRLDDAEIRATDALVRYSIALARIRYETGLLPATVNRSATISIDDFRTLPRQSDLESIAQPSK